VTINVTALTVTQRGQCQPLISSQWQIENLQESQFEVLQESVATVEIRRIDNLIGLPLHPKALFFQPIDVPFVSKSS
jgi:hypothetical protein